MSLIRLALFLCGSVIFRAAQAQTAPSALAGALNGHWTGILEYRDYAEPPSSTKRVQLPTWLTVEGGAVEGGRADLRFHYIYDDAPGKVVEGRSEVVLNVRTLTWSVTEDGHSRQFDVAGLDGLKEGRGVLTLIGAATENDKPVDERETFTVRRNLLIILEETRPAGSSEAFVFRHRYLMTRSLPPAAAPAR